MKRILLGGVLGGLAMFFWEGLAHEVLPLGQAGLNGLAIDSAVPVAAKQGIRQAGLYMFPWYEETPQMTSDQKKQGMQKAMEQAKAGPTGMMVVYPEGRDYSAGKLLATQAVLDILVMLLAAVLVARGTVLKSYGARAGFVGALGLIPGLTVHLPFWNWYGFPTAYATAQIVMHIVAFVVGGLVVGALVRPRFA